MKPPNFPEFITNLPQADLPVEGAGAWLVQSEKGQVMFLIAEQQLQIPAHSHGDQWGIVIEGQMELTIGEKTETYRQGDSYFIPGGTMHKAILYKGFRALDYFADKDRYKTKA